MVPREVVTGDDTKRAPALGNARATLERFRILLDALDDSAFQGRPLSESRAAWEKWLQDANEQLQKLSPAEKD